MDDGSLHVLVSPRLLYHYFSVHQSLWMLTGSVAVQSRGNWQSAKTDQVLRPKHARNCAEHGPRGF